MDFSMGIIGLILDFLLFIQLLRKGLHRNFPLFAIYIIESLLSSVTMLAAYRVVSTNAYFGIYSVDFAISSLLQLAVLIELVWSTIKPIHHALPRMSWLVVLLLISFFGLMMWPLAGIGMPHTLTTSGLIFFRLQIIISFLRIGVFLVIAVASHFLSIGWRDREMQIATGFSFYSFFYLAITEIHMHQSFSTPALVRLYHFFDQLVVLSYLASLLYWLLMFSLKEAPRKEFTGAMAALVLRLSNKSSLAGPSVTNSHKSGAE